MSSWTQHFRSDMQAGLTVALVGLPQCLAYAMIAGLPPAYGLSCAAVAGMIAIFVGKSPQIVTGPTNTTALLVFGALTPFLASNGLLDPKHLGILATLTLMAGVLRIVMVYVGGAKLLRFIPVSVLVGFTAGAGTLIAVMQLDEALGMKSIVAAGLLSEFRGLWGAWSTGHFPALPAVFLTLFTIVSIALGKRFAPKIPVTLLVVVLAAVVAWAAGLDTKSGLALVMDRSTLPNGWPPGALPDLDLQTLQMLLFPALAITLIGTMELTISAYADGAKPEIKREILAQGWANTLGAFLSSFPASASLTRSVLLRMTGAKTRFSAFLGAIFTGVILLFFTSAVGYIPLASLAGVLIVTAAKMIDLSTIRRLIKASKISRSLLLITFLATLFLPLAWSILTGVGLGLLIQIAESSSPRIRTLKKCGNCLQPTDGSEKSLEVVIIEVSGSLYYAAVPPFIEEVEQRLPNTVSTVVIDLSHAHQLRYKAMIVLEALHQKLADEQIVLRLSGVSQQFGAFLARAQSSLQYTLEEAEPGRSIINCLDASPSQEK